ncbi:MAG: hypothetical protein ABIR59_03890 [Gemmatimonadales bacterium]
MRLRKMATATAIAALLAAGCSRRTNEPEPTRVRAPTQVQTDSLASTGQRATSSGTGGTSGAERLPAVQFRSASDTTGTGALRLLLAQIGYRGGITLLGALDEATVSVPVNPGLRPSTLTLDVVPTPGMPAATLVLRQRDRILGLRPLTDTTTTVTFPLNDAIIDQGKATFTLGITVPGRDACEAQVYYRTVLLPSSAVAFIGSPRAVRAINGFFAPWLERVTFHVADSPSLDAAQAALDAAAFVARRYRGMATEYRIAPLPPVGTPMVEPGPWERAVLWNPAGSTMIIGPDSGRGTVLAIGARRDARQLFTFIGGADLVTSSSFQAGAIDLDRVRAEETGVRTLAELGFADRTVEGNTLVIADFPFALADFGEVASPTAFRLIAEHSIIPEVGHGSVRVHLNGALIWSKSLDRTSIDEVVAIPAHLLQRDNALQVRFQVVLGEGRCILGSQVFTATIDAASAFVIDGINRLPPGFARFPSAFLPGFSVLLEPRDRYRVELAATVIGAMQQTTRTPLAPALARDRAGAIGPLLAVGTSSLADELEAPVHADGFRLRDRKGRIWDEFTPGTSYAAMQGWQKGGDDVLLLHHTGTNGQPLADLLRESLEPYGWFGVRGDLVIRGEQGTARSLTIANAGWRVEAQPDSSSSFFAKYRKVLFGAAAVILIMLLWWGYPRVVRRELDTAG